MPAVVVGFEVPAVVAAWEGGGGGGVDGMETGELVDELVVGEAAGCGVETDGRLGFFGIAAWRN